MVYAELKPLQIDIVTDLTPPACLSSCLCFVDCTVQIQLQWSYTSYNLKIRAGSAPVSYPRGIRGEIRILGQSPFAYDPSPSRKGMSDRMSSD